MNILRTCAAVGNLLAVLAFGPSALAATVTLRWNANGESDLGGYTVAFGQAPGAYSGSVDVGKVTEVGIPGLNEGTRYYFALKAYDSSGNQSPASAEVSVVTAAAGPPDTAAPTIAAVSTSHAGVVTVTFSEAVDAATAEDPSHYVIDGGQVAVHSATLEADGRTVRLTTDLQTADAFYTISVTGVADLAATPNLSSQQVAYQVDLGLNLSVVSPAGYDVFAVTPGDPYYVDRTLPIDAIPMQFRGADWIRTADADNGQTATQWLTFTADHDVVVYVGYDRRSNPPDWVTENFVPLGDGPASDNAGTPLTMWARDFPAGEIVLGGNAAPGSGNAQRNYVVLVKALPAAGTTADADADGMDDAWEAANGLDPARLDSHDDPDTDGHTNLEEFWLGTDPLVAEPVAGGTSLPPTLTLDTSVVGLAGQPITLDASGATDPDGDPLAWAWHQILGPAVTLSGADQPTATLTAQDTGLYAFTVAVRDGSGAATAQTVYVEVFEDILSTTTTALGANLLVSTGPLAGTLLSIPSGAMDKAYPVAVGSGAMPAALPSGYEAVSDVLIFSPSEIQLLAPATIRLPYQITQQVSRAKAGDPLDLLQYDMLTGAWTSVPIGRDLGNVVEANVDTLGTFVVTTKPAGGGIGGSVTGAAGGGGCAAGTTGGPVDALPFLLALLWAVGRGLVRATRAGTQTQAPSRSGAMQKNLMPFAVPFATLLAVAGLALLPAGARADTVPPSAPAGLTVTGTTLNNVPTISATPVTSIAADTPFSLVPVANDLDGESLTFSIVNRPSWATFSTSTGALTGTPTTSNAGITSGIVISVTDSHQTASLPAFNLTVEAPTIINGAPTILYSDLDRGPSGAFVTVWGQNIPSSATFTCGNQPCEIVMPLAQDVRHPAHGAQPSRQRVVVRFDGGSGISLDGGNTLPFTLTNGTVRELNPPSVDLGSANSGDVVYLHGGTYTTSQGKWNSAVIVPKNGVSVVGYPGETAVIRCSSILAFDALDGDMTGFTMANLEMDCGSSGRAINASRVGSRTNLRIVGNYVHDARAASSGAFGEFSKVTDTYILGNRIDRTGVPGENQAQGIYMGGRGTNRNFYIKWNTMDTHVGGRSIQFFGHDTGESLDNYDVSYNHIMNAEGNAAILFSHSDGGSGGISDPSKGWLKNGVANYNTVEGGNGAGIKIMAANADMQVIGNVLSGGNDSVLVEFVHTVLIKDNCMDQSPTLRQSSGVTQQNNATNYPACLP